MVNQFKNLFFMYIMSNNLTQIINDILKNVEHNMDDDTQNKFIKYYLWREHNIGERPTEPYIEGFRELARYVEMMHTDKMQREYYEKNNNLSLI